MRLKQIFGFRGLSERLSKNNKKYFLLNFEGDNGEGYQFLTTNEELAKSLQRGTKYLLSFFINGSAFIDGIAQVK